MCKNMSINAFVRVCDQKHCVDVQSNTSACVLQYVVQVTMHCVIVCVDVCVTVCVAVEL